VPACALQIIETPLQRRDDLVEFCVAKMAVEVNLFEHNDKSDYPFLLSQSQDSRSLAS
jgi:hypothetical protein